MIRKIFIATHANLAEGFKNAARLIAGESADLITTFCLQEGGSADEFSEIVKEYLLNNKEQEVVILTDLFGASLFNAMSVLSVYENAFIFTGTNLAMLLDLLLDPTPLNKNVIEEKLNMVREGSLWFEGFESETEEDF